MNEDCSNGRVDVERVARVVAVVVLCDWLWLWGRLAPLRWRGRELGLVAVGHGAALVATRTL